jgi:hypothetical protein
MKNEHYIQRQELEQVVEAHSDAALARDASTLKTLHLWLEYLLTVPKNRQILKKVHEAQEQKH